MDIETVQAHCASKPGATSDYPFDSETLVFRVAGRIFALIPVMGLPPRVNLKCDPAMAEILRQTYSTVVPGYHMSQRPLGQAQWLALPTCNERRAECIRRVDNRLLYSPCTHCGETMMRMHGSREGFHCTSVRAFIV